MELLKVVIGFVLVFALVIWLMKKTAKVAVTIIVVIAIVCSLFFWSGESMSKYLDKLLTPGISHKIVSLIYGFRNKNAELGIVDTEKLLTSFNYLKNIAFDKLNNREKEQLIIDISKKLYEGGVKNINEEQLQQDLVQLLGGMSKEGISLMSKEITNVLKELSQNNGEFKNLPILLQKSNDNSNN